MNYGYRIVGTTEKLAEVGLFNSLDSIVCLQALRGSSWSRTLIWIAFETDQGRMSSYSPAVIEKEIEAHVAIAAAIP